MRPTWGTAALSLLASVALVTGPFATAAAAPYPPKAPTCAVTPAAGAPGTPIRVDGAHWKPGAAVSVTLVRGRPKALGSATVASGGRFSLQTRVPTFVRPGRGIIRVRGLDASGKRRSCVTRFRVLSKTTAASATLPRAGTGLTTGGLISLLGLATAVVVIRRRRGRSLWFLHRRDALSDLGRRA